MLHALVSRPLDYKSMDTLLQQFCIGFAKWVVLYHMCMILHWFVYIVLQLTCIAKKNKSINLISTTKFPHSLLCNCGWYDLYSRKSHIECDRHFLATSHKTTPNSNDKSLNTNEN